MSQYFNIFTKGKNLDKSPPCPDNAVLYEIGAQFLIAPCRYFFN